MSVRASNEKLECSHIIISLTISQFYELGCCGEGGVDVRLELVFDIFFPGRQFGINKAFILV